MYQSFWNFTVLFNVDFLVKKQIEQFKMIWLNEMDYIKIKNHHNYFL